jgi:hypothetical protein
VPGSDELLEVRPRSRHFGCWVNSCCSCRIPEVPTSQFPIYSVLKSLEGSGKARGTVRVKGNSIPWVVQVEGKFVGGLELTESLTT